MANTEVSVVGIQHRVTKATQRRVAEYLDDNDGIFCEVNREPDNPVDENALKVVIAEAPFTGLHIGYLPRTVAAVYAERMDNEGVKLRGCKLISLDVDEGTGVLSIGRVTRKAK